MGEGEQEDRLTNSHQTHHRTERQDNMPRMKTNVLDCAHKVLGLEGLGGCQQMERNV